ncbi:MAG: helicase-related protein [Bdellovibrionota bacterium]
MAQLLLLTSPPASGKTFWIRSFAEASEKEILVISPLRALADECRIHWKEKIRVMTPEEWSIKKTYSDIMIFDEFHLLYYWGDSFRPVLWDVFVSLSLEAKLVIGLTATLSEKMRDDVLLLHSGFEEILWLNFGNQELKNFPDKYLRLNQKLIHESLIHLPVNGTTLVFCEYREEVLEWEKKLSRRGYKVWTCRGGEAAAFGEKVRRENPPDFIVCTTVLSHGVNLPVIERLFLMYPVKNKDFWIQMVARGGRKGEAYRVFALEPPHGLRWDRRNNLCQIGILRLRILFSIFMDQLQECFLKE